MKRSLKLRSGCRFTLVFVMLLATAGWVGSVCAAGKPDHLKSGQKEVKALPAAQSTHPVVTVRPGQAAAGPGQAVPIVIKKGLPGFVPQKAGARARKPASAAKESPAQVSAIVKKTSEFLASPKFRFLPDKALDPFVPFISLQTNGNGVAPGSGPLTPLQKMTLAEMEKGLKAIVWGGLGRMAVIEDSTGKGYIVNVGTPAGPNGGVITQIDDHSLVIQQEVWNSQTRKRVPEDFTVKMVKKDDES